jgi:predicted dinucleotide-binding enzyme
MKIAVIGPGHVGSSLGARFANLGHEIVYGVRDPEGDRARELYVAAAGNVRLSSIPDAIRAAEIVVLATPFEAAVEVVRGAGELDDRIVVDCTNPIGPGLTLAVGGDDSGGERVARAGRGGRFVKAFNTYGYENFSDSSYPGHGDLRPLMFLCGTEGKARTAVAGLATDLGFRPVDLGGMEAARLLEPLAMIWIRMARVQGKGANFTWAMLER